MEKVCIRENSHSGEPLLYIPKNKEECLLKTLRQKNILKRLFLWIKKEKLSQKQLKEKLIALLTEAFFYNDKNPMVDIHFFFKKYEVKLDEEYWPDSDRF
ncbi:hypothetical protein [Flagellimonas oceanensis]|uniref:hypothetical protein n=1 Tax=Flagellimonas oceanensis TaxID=2499163 RepID=UPI003BABB04B|tara:strand:- start:6610 stop:6909 length:300 start_codon:yes stop_codon:yes gene_type:complete